MGLVSGILTCGFALLALLAQAEQPLDSALEQRGRNADTIVGAQATGRSAPLDSNAVSSLNDRNSPVTENLTPDEQREFDIAFRSSLYSGIISGIITGMVVGLTIYWIERAFERKRYMRELQREFAILVGDLKSISARRVIFSIDRIANPPDTMRLIAEAIRTRPIDLYQTYLKDKHIRIGAIQDFQDAFERYSATGETLDAIVRRLIRHHLSKDGTDAANDPTVYVYIAGKLLDKPDEEIAPYIDGATGTGWVGEAYEVVTQHQDFEVAKKEYLVARDAMNTAYGKLMVSLIFG